MKLHRKVNKGTFDGMDSNKRKVFTVNEKNKRKEGN